MFGHVVRTNTALAILLHFITSFQASFSWRSYGRETFLDTPLTSSLGYRCLVAFSRWNPWEFHFLGVQVLRVPQFRDEKG
mgnify:CR=1 FL=1